MPKNQKGFTIIELIVVIAIIAVLAAVVLVNVQGYIAKARNAKRLSDITGYIKALTLYYADNSSYPNGSLCCLGSVANNGNPTGSSCGSGCAANAALASYIPGAPGANLIVNGAVQPYWYDMKNSNKQYSLYYTLEGLNQSCGAGYNNGGFSGYTYCKYDSQ